MYGIERSPTGIYQNQFNDCKHYALFAGGILDSLNREGKNIDWCYRFANYRLFTRDLQHVFVVVFYNGKEYWIDPVLDYFNCKKEYVNFLDKKPMALYKVSGITVPGSIQTSIAKTVLSDLFPVISPFVGFLQSFNIGGGSKIVVQGLELPVFFPFIQKYQAWYDSKNDVMYVLVGYTPYPGEDDPTTFVQFLYRTNDPNQMKPVLNVPSNFVAPSYINEDFNYTLYELTGLPPDVIPDYWKNYTDTASVINDTVQGAQSDVIIPVGACFIGISHYSAFSTNPHMTAAQLQQYITSNMPPLPSLPVSSKSPLNLKSMNSTVNTASIPTGLFDNVKNLPPGYPYFVSPGMVSVQGYDVPYQDLTATEKGQLQYVVNSDAIQEQYFLSSGLESYPVAAISPIPVSQSTLPGQSNSGIAPLAVTISERDSPNGTPVQQVVQTPVVPSNNNTWLWVAAAVVGFVLLTSNNN
jgi:hypothetical protein